MEVTGSNPVSPNDLPSKTPCFAAYPCNIRGFLFSVSDRCESFPRLGIAILHTGVPIVDTDCLGVLSVRGLEMELAGNQFSVVLPVADGVCGKAIGQLRRPRFPHRLERVPPREQPGPAKLSPHVLCRVPIPNDEELVFGDMTLAILARPATWLRSRASVTGGDWRPRKRLRNTIIRHGESRWASGKPISQKRNMLPDTG